MSIRSQTIIRLAFIGLLIFPITIGTPSAGSEFPPTNANGVAPVSAINTSLSETIDTYCVTCHNERLTTAGLDLKSLAIENVETNRELWEKVVKKVRVGAMPPTGVARPDQATYESFIAMLEETLDSTSEVNPNPGRPPVHRLNRLQYTNAIRDLFGLEIDGQTMLPADDSGYGFDNIGDVLTLSPALLDRYLLAATKISRLVVGDPKMRATQTTYPLPNLTLGQDERMSEHLPFGSRGGIAIRHYFPLDGEYVINVRLQRSDAANGYRIRGLGAPSEIDVRLDRRRLELFKVGGPEWLQAYQKIEGLYTVEEELVDKAFEVRFQATAGTHIVGISFRKDRWDMEGVGPSSLPETSAPFSRGVDTVIDFGRIDAGIDKVDIRGPFEGKLSPESSIRKGLFICQPTSEADEAPCARQILSAIAKRAYRRPVTDQEVDTLIEFYEQGQTEGNFDYGIQTALARMLMDVNFLFKIERDPDDVNPGDPYSISDFEFSTRLAFFLWSSIPDDELLALAEQGQLRNPEVLDQQIRRMLQDKRSRAMVENFFGQWLMVRNLSVARPDPKFFPDFDENLREAFLRETNLFLENQFLEDRSATELLTADYTFVNQRLAEHYGIQGVIGSHFRRVKLLDNSRAGLLGHGSVLTVTSYNDRTSVVMRGKWVMENILGTPPPPPPPNVPALDQTEIKGSLRQRMELHRSNPVCASCHSKLDPLGFALENFDAIGKFRTVDGNTAVDPSGTMLDGHVFDGPVSFREALTSHQDAFLSTMTENLLTYALGRGVEPYDMPAVRRILSNAANNNYRWSSLIGEIVKSMPFQMRRAES